MENNELSTLIGAFTDIVGAAFESAKWYKHGMHEDVYETGLYIELKEKGYVVQRQKDFPVFYKGTVTQKHFRMDLVVMLPSGNNIILELKAVNRIDDQHRKQLWSYMRLTNTKYGMLINFSPTIVYTEKFEYILETNSVKRLVI